ncbi:hypothetical protein JOB18_039897 [Solea senegalensis]|uniref:Uncharacterized protein n=1 Tax=Solea senegalensis TaxID=28829 RepID=A0AAV6PLB1_SOLSE|nr:hypothetical protein JOB18_039897 [Solea senegalensis]
MAGNPELEENHNEAELSQSGAVSIRKVLHAAQSRQNDIPTLRNFNKSTQKVEFTRGDAELATFSLKYTL